MRDGSLMSKGKGLYMYVLCILYTLGSVYYIRPKSGGCGGGVEAVVPAVRAVYWCWGAHFDGNFHCPTSTNICLVTRF